MFGFKEKKEPWRGGVYLTTVDSTMQADILISKLAGEGIPCMKRHEGASNFLELCMGMSTMFPVELYVPEESLEQALKIIEPIPIEDDFDEISEEELAALAEAGDLEVAEAALRSGEEYVPEADGNDAAPDSEEALQTEEPGAEPTAEDVQEPAAEEEEEEEEEAGSAEIPEPEREAPPAEETEPENRSMDADDEDGECR